MIDITILRQKISYLGHQVAKHSITPVIVAEIMQLLADINESLSGFIDSNSQEIKDLASSLNDKITEECLKAFNVVKINMLVEDINEGDKVNRFDTMPPETEIPNVATQRHRIVYYAPDKAFYAAYISFTTDGNTTYNFYRQWNGVELYMQEEKPRKTVLYVDDYNQIYFFIGEKLTLIGMSNRQIEDITESVETLEQSAVKSDNCSNHDLAVMDEKGNVIIAVDNGHIKTKEFDSSKIQTKQEIQAVEIPETDESGQRPEVNGANFIIDGDLAFSDEKGNMVAVFKNGHIKTKNFSSEEFDETYVRPQPTAGLTISFLGDSITTYGGFIPNGYAQYYPSGDVNAVAKCYWKKVVDELQLKLGVNASWSGSYVHGDGKANTAAPGCSDGRINALEANGTPDIIVIYIGINDFDEGTALGEYTAEQKWLENSAYNDFSSAYALMLQKLMKKYPAARIFACTLMDASYKDADAQFPTVRADGTKLSDFNRCIRNLVTEYGLNLVEMHSCGIRWANMETFYVDKKLHPNAKGHDLMAKTLKNEILKFY